MAKYIHKLAAPPWQHSQSTAQVTVPEPPKLTRAMSSHLGRRWVLRLLVLLCTYGLWFRYGALWNNGTWLLMAMVVLGVLTLGAWQQQRWRRAVWLSAYWAPTSWGQRRLQGGYFMALWQGLKMMCVMPFLLVGPFLFDAAWQWLWLVALTLAAPLVFWGWQQVLRSQVKEVLLPLLAWRLSWWSLTLIGVAFYLWCARGTLASAPDVEALFQQSRSTWMASTWLAEVYQWVSLKAALRWAIGHQLSLLWAHEELRLLWRLLLHLPEVLWCGIWLRVVGYVGFLPGPSAQEPSWKRHVVVALLVLVMVGLGLRDWRKAPQLLVMDGHYYVVTPAQQTLLMKAMTSFWEWQEASLQQQVAQAVREDITQLFAAARERVPQVVASYYSLGAEYERMLLAGAQWLFQKPSNTHEDLRRQLLPELEEEAWFEQLLSKTHRIEAAWQETSLKQWRTYVEQLLGEPLPTYMRPPKALTEISIEPPSALALAQQQFEQRQTISAAALGVGVVSGVGARYAFTRMGRRQAASQLAKSASARIGGSALLCAPSGVGALGCAAVGAVAWLVTDFALLKLEQHQQGSELEQALLMWLHEQEQSVLKQWHLQANKLPAVQGSQASEE